MATDGAFKEIELLLLKGYLLFCIVTLLAVGIKILMQTPFQACLSSPFP